MAFIGGIGFIICFWIMVISIYDGLWLTSLISFSFIFLFLWTMSLDNGQSWD